MNTAEEIGLDVIDDEATPLRGPSDVDASSADNNQNMPQIEAPQTLPSRWQKLQSRWEKIKVQTLSSTAISLSMMHMGMAISFPNLLTGRKNPDVIKNFASFGALATPFGSLFTCFVSDRLGRKTTLIIFEILSALTWFLVGMADEDNLGFFYTTGIFTGIMRGALTSHSPAFISEITHKELRQMFLSFTTLFFTIAYCLTSLLNLWLSWKSAAWCFGGIFVLLTILTYSYVHESPHWLMFIKNDETRAKSILRKYIPDKDMFNQEWSVLEETKKESDKRNNSGANNSERNNSEANNSERNNSERNNTEANNSGKKSLISLIKDPKLKIFKRSIILLFLLFFQQACCIYPLSAFARHVVGIISKPMEKHKDSIFIFLSIVRLLISIVTTIFLSRFSQTQLLTISWVGMVVCGVGLVGTELVKQSSLDLIGWNDGLLVGCFVLYTIFGCVAAVGVPWTIIFELLPTDVRGTLGPFFVAIGYVVMAGFLHQFLDTLKNIGVVCTFLFITVTNLVGCIFIYFSVTETQGISLNLIGVIPATPAPATPAPAPASPKPESSKL